MEIYTKMPTPGSIGAGQTATTKLLIGMTHNRIDIRCNAQIAAAPKDLAATDWATVFGDIRLIINGQTKVEMSAAHAVARAQYYGYTLQPGVLPIHLAMPWLKLPGDSQVTGIGTTGLSTFNIEMDINAAQTINSLDIYSNQTDPSPYGKHLEIARYNQNVGVTGQLEIADLPKRAGAFLTAFHLDTSAVSDLNVKSNQVDILQSDAATRANALVMAGRVPQTGYTHWDFLSRDALADMVTLQVQDFRIRPNFTSTGNVHLYTEEVVVA